MSTENEIDTTALDNLSNEIPIKTQRAIVLDHYQAMTESVYAGTLRLQAAQLGGNTGAIKAREIELEAFLKQRAFYEGKLAEINKKIEAEPRRIE